ncbi:MAG: glycosyltransferase family 4 protein, partial [Kordiimonadaceae bacterium]|nr:glycosyltransferase family 4 protein [Kordiimonadaceae bacterium]
NVGFALNKFLLPLIDVQLSNGDEVVAVCADDEYVSDLREAGYRVETLSITRGMNPLKHLHSIWVIFWFLRKEKFDLVHVHTPVAALLGRIAARLCGVPLVVYTAHGFYFHDEMSTTKRAFFVGLERFAGRWTSLLFTQSCEDAKAAVIEKIMPKDLVFVIGNGVDVSRFNPGVGLVNNRIRSELEIAEDNFIVGMIGRQVKEKGILELLEAAQVLIEKYEDISFIIVGDRLNSDHAEGVEAAINKATALSRERLIFTGMRSDIPQLLAVMDLFTLPSWREGMPRTIIEAMMMALPVVATDIRGSREEVIDGETGLLVPLRNTKALTQAIELLYKDRKKSKKMGEASRKRALEIYNEKKVIEKQLTIINTFINNDNK